MSCACASDDFLRFLGFIMDVTANSTIMTVSHMDLNIGEKEPVSISSGILEFQRLFGVLSDVPLICPMSKKNI